MPAYLGQCDPAPSSLSGARRSLATLDEMNRVMLYVAYLVCPQRWQSTTGNQKWLPVEVYNFLLMRDILNVILTEF